KRSVDIASHEAILLAGSDASKKERSVFYRGVERTTHSEAPVKISQRFVQSLTFFADVSAFNTEAIKKGRCLPF
ncbi:MAG: hypothetical protein J6C40_07530, partial [Lentisphaeria bacterium]|nr:hypothetical protein [Lentisphaeria bacterium]